MRPSALTTLFIACASLAGCGSPPPPIDATPRVPAASVHGPGVVKGVVRFNGPKPPEKIIRNEPCCTGAPPTLRDESITINPNGTLANVVLTLEGGPKANGADLPPALLDQVFCQYSPHVIGVVVGQTLTIRSSDPTTHNVHMRPKFGPTRNYWMQRAGESSQTTFTQPEIVKTGCDVHPWMSAYIAVVDNPLFAITQGTGAFEISNIPPGEYKLVAWHEIFGRREQPLTIAADQKEPLTLDFIYQPPAAK